MYNYDVDEYIYWDGAVKENWSVGCAFAFVRVEQGGDANARDHSCVTVMRVILEYSFRIARDGTEIGEVVEQGSVSDGMAASCRLCNRHF